MTREEIIDAIMVMEAYLEGHEIQKCGKKWNPKHWCDTDEPCWDFDSCEYRIKPTATLRPWTADEVPVGGQIRSKQSRDYRFLIDRTANADVRKDWLNGYEHSTDGGKTWLPCGVVEESK